MNSKENYQFMITFPFNCTLKQIQSDCSQNFKLTCTTLRDKNPAHFQGFVIFHYFFSIRVCGGGEGGPPSGGWDIPPSPDFWMRHFIRLKEFIMQAELRARPPGQQCLQIPSLRSRTVSGICRGSDASSFYLDPDPTWEKKPDPTFKTNRIRIRPERKKPGSRLVLRNKPDPT